MDQFCILCGEYVEIKHKGYVYTLTKDEDDSTYFVCERCFSKKLNEGRQKRDCLYCENESDFTLENNLAKYSLSASSEPLLVPQKDARDIICQEHFDYLQEDRSRENLPLEGTMYAEDDDKEENNILSEPTNAYHAFISHASENKELVARPLAEELTNKGLNVWYDDFELSVGDSLTQSIENGLSNSDYGVVIVSDEFMQKDWTQRELNALQSRGVGRNKIVLPVWYEVSEENVREFSPSLADKLAIKAIEENIPQVAEELYEEITG